MKIFILLLFTLVSFGQEGIVSGGNSIETFGAIFPVIQQSNSEYSSVSEEVSLSVPKFDFPTEPAKPALPPKKENKKSLFEKIVDFIKKIINKKK